MLRTAGFKFNVYSKGEDNEQFFNLLEDPGECRNLVRDPAYAGAINEHRQLLRMWMDNTVDPFTCESGDVP
jgi:hypothetical protein